jgi:hypothetical protein
MGRRNKFRRSGHRAYGSAPCSCGGSNENCAFCFGTGVRGGNLGIPPKSENESPPDREYFYNPKDLGKLLSAVNPLRSTSTGHTPSFPGCHIIAVVSDSDSKPVAPEPSSHPPSKARLRTVHCPSCGAPFAFQVGLKEHLAKGRCPKLSQQKPLGNRGPKFVVLPARVGRANKQSTVSKTRAPESSNLIQCAECSAKVKPSRMMRHMRKAHHSMPRPVRQDPKGLTNSAPSIKTQGLTKILPAEHLSKDAFEQAVGIDHRDRTRGYGYPVRENGRYGSHPMHDGFDNEAGPE